MKKQDTLWERKPHTAAKHAILRKYLGAWFPKLASWKRRVVFIDGFAGPGEYKDGAPGSPMIAIDAAISHKADLSSCELVYFFVEQDKKRYQHLTSLLDALECPSNVKYQAVHGRFADQVAGILDDVESRGATMAPALVMIDPFGFGGTPFDLIARIAEQPKSEVLISFMYESVVRFRNHKDHPKTFDGLFGCPDWRGADELATADERRRFLIELYVAQLEKAGFQYVQHFEMIDEGNRTEYFLVFGSHSIHGLMAMKAAMWAADPSGRFQFSDASVSSQLALIKPEPDFEVLKALILERFSGKEATIGQIERFVLVETPYRESHFKRQILRNLESEGKIEIVKSNRKRAKSYPVGTLIRFE